MSEKKKPKRVLHCINSLAVASGAMSVIMNYYRNIQRDEVQFDFLYFQEDGETHFQEIQSLGGRAFDIGIPSFCISFQKKLDSFFCEHQGEFDILHCHMVFAPSVYSFMAKKNGIKHVIAHSHSTKKGERSFSIVRNSVLNLFVGFFATDFLACSEAAARAYWKKKSNKGNVLVLHNAVETNDFWFDVKKREKIRNEFNIMPEELVVGHVGRFVEPKNHKFQVEIFRLLCKEKTNYKLFLVGDGPLLVDIKQLVDKYGLTNRVIFTGSRSDVPDLLCAMDVFLFPSLYEGLPVTLVEAQCNGIPSVVSEAITKEVVVTDLIQFASLNESAEIWAEKLEKLALNSKHVKRSEYTGKVRENGYDIADTTRVLEDFYRKLM